MVNSCDNSAQSGVPSSSRVLSRGVLSDWERTEGCHRRRATITQLRYKTPLNVTFPSDLITEYHRFSPLIPVNVRQLLPITPGVSSRVLKILKNVDRKSGMLKNVRKVTFVGYSAYKEAFMAVSHRCWTVIHRSSTTFLTVA